MKYIRLTMLLMLIATAGMAQQEPDRVLIYSKTLKYHHNSIPDDSIPDAIAAIQKLWKEHRFQVDTTTNSANFSTAYLRKFNTIIFLSTSGNVLDSIQKINFKKYIEAGGGFVGIHSASTSDKNWTWYGHLVGAVFINHPEPQPAIVKVVDNTNEATKNLPKRWSCNDEWYNFRDTQSDLHILLEADETTCSGGTNGINHPLAWYHSYDGGRSFYTALGHFSKSYTDPLFLGHILAGIEYAMGR